MGKRDEVLTARANRIARHTVKRWAAKNDCVGILDGLPKVFVKHVRRGRTNLTRREKITIPSWTYRRFGRHYFRYYVLHEIAHAISLVTKADGLRGSGHTLAFHRIEEQLCDEWNLELRRVSAYPKSIDYKGQEVYNRRDMK